MNDTPRTQELREDLVGIASEAQIWKLFKKLEDMERELNAVTEQRDVASQCHKWCYEDRKRIIEELTSGTEQRDEALSDLEFRRDLFKLQEQQLNDVRAERDELLRYNEAFRKETLICADCDAISKEEYDQAIEQRDRLAAVVNYWRKGRHSGEYGVALRRCIKDVDEALQSLTT